MKTVCNRSRYRHINQWNRKGSLEVDPHIHDQLISNKDVMAIQWGKYNIFNKWYWKKLNIHMYKYKRCGRLFAFGWWTKT